MYMCVYVYMCIHIYIYIYIYICIERGRERERERELSVAGHMLLDAVDVLIVTRPRSISNVTDTIT